MCAEGDICARVLDADCCRFTDERLLGRYCLFSSKLANLRLLDIRLSFFKGPFVEIDLSALSSGGFVAVVDVNPLLICLFATRSVVTSIMI